MKARWLAAGCTVLVSVIGCTGHPAVMSTGPASRDILLLDTAAGSVVLDAGGDSVLARNPGSVAAPDGSRLYATRITSRSTTIQTRDATTGALLSTATVRGKLDVSVASLSGSLVALTTPQADAGDSWIPVPRARSTIVVADPSGVREARRYRLHGNFVPEAFSVNDTRLFLIQYLPAEAPAAYRVTFLDLRTGRVQEVFGRFKTPPQRMPGERLRQIFDPQTEQLYTLYTNHSPAYQNGYWDSPDGDELTFVHVLNLRVGWAFCAGLPRSLWNHPASAEAMAPSPDGRILYIVDSIRGVIAEMDTRTLKILRSTHVDLGSDTGARTAAVTSADGRTLFVSSSTDPHALYAIETSDLTVAARWTVPAAVSDLGVSKDGGRLYAAMADRVAVLDAATGSQIGALSIDGVASIVRVETPAP
jgi:WD40 repeat protein